MYIFELLCRALFRKNKTLDTYNPLDAPEDLIENSDDCEHFFMPLDSTNTLFACKYCGLVVKKDGIKKQSNGQ